MGVVASRDFVINKLTELETRAQKKFGQNFLIRDEMALGIVKHLTVEKGDHIIEIGPGLGALTNHLKEYENEITLFDIDPIMIDHLTKYFSYHKNVHPVLQDILKADLDSYTGNVRIIGNLPYYITTPILEKVICSKANIIQCVMMIQQEVMERLLAEPGDPAYGPLSIMLSYVGKVNKLIRVGSWNFYPAPNIDSEVFEIIFKKDLDRNNVKPLFNIVNSLFLMRRKTILNNLTSLIHDKEKALDILKACNINEKTRPEQLKLQDYLNIQKQINA